MNKLHLNRKITLAYRPGAAYIDGMHSLQGIIRMNNKAAVRAEDNYSRHCSFSGNATDGVVLHSAKLRNTVFLAGNGGKFVQHCPAEHFLAEYWSRNSQEQRDILIESYFV